MLVALFFWGGTGGGGDRRVSVSSFCLTATGFFVGLFLNIFHMNQQQTSYCVRHQQTSVRVRLSADWPQVLLCDTSSSTKMQFGLYLNFTKYFYFHQNRPVNMMFPLINEGTLVLMCYLSRTTLDFNTVNISVRGMRRGWQ